MDPARQQLPPLTFPLQFLSTIGSKAVLHFLFLLHQRSCKSFFWGLAAYPSSLGPLPQPLLPSPRFLTSASAVGLLPPQTAPALPVMSNTDFLGRAIDTVKKAIENDNDGEYEKAYQMYYSALELFMLALKWEKNPKSKEMIRSKAGEYMDRAEKLKNHLAEDRKKPSAVGANGKVAQGSGKGGYVSTSWTKVHVLAPPYV